MENNITECRACGEKKQRILMGKFNQKDKKYSDEHGKLWNGRKCPECVVRISREAVRIRRSKPESAN